MIDVIGTENFRLESYVSERNTTDVLINAYINTSRVNETPFASIVIRNYNEWDDLIISDFHSYPGNFLLFLKEVSILTGVSVVKKYTDAYDEIANGFSFDIKLHNVLCVLDWENRNLPEKRKESGYHDILILSDQIDKGILQPIRKSPSFALYDGKFISTKDKNLLFLVVDISDIFHYDQAEKSTDDGEILISRKTYSPCVFRDTMINPGNIIYEKRIIDDCEEIRVPYWGREYLLQTKRTKNLFSLQNIPNHIIQRKDGSIEVKKK